MIPSGMRTQHSSPFNHGVVLGVLRKEKALAEIAAERRVHPSMVYRLRALTLTKLPSMFTHGERGGFEQEDKVHERYAAMVLLSTELA